MPKKKSAKKTVKGKETSKKKLESLSQTHGKEEKFAPTTLDQVWGHSGSTRFGTIDVNQYIRRLDEMNLTDLQAHAHYVGFVPVDDRVTLSKKLILEFKKYVSGFKKPSSQPIPNPNISEAAKKILSEGR